MVKLYRSVCGVSDQCIGLKAISG